MLNRKKFLPLLLYIGIFISCSSEKEESLHATKGIREITVPAANGVALPWEELMEDVNIIALETTKKSQIGEITKIICRHNRIYVLDERGKRLLVFGISGKFLFKLSGGQRGPGELYQIFDFQVDEAQNIHVLDYMKVKKYSPGGEFLSEFDFKELANTTPHFYPRSFALSADSSWFFWTGTLLMNEMVEGNQIPFGIHKVSMDGPIQKKYFPMSVRILGGNKFFTAQGGDFNIKPITGSDTVFKIKDSEVVPFLYVNFGENSLPTDFFNSGIQNSISGQLKTLSTTLYCSQIDEVVETEHHIYFTYVQQNLIKNALYSKKSGKVWSGDVTFRKNFITPLLITSSYENHFVSVIEPFVFISYVDEIKKNGKAPADPVQTKMRNTLRKMNISDNPYLLLFKIKE